MDIAIGLFDFNSYLVQRREGAQGLFEVLSEAGEPVDVVKEERDGLLTSVKNPLHSYLIQ